MLMYDPLSQKIYMTVPLTSSEQNSSELLLGYNPQFDWNKIIFFSS